MMKQSPAVVVAGIDICTGQSYISTLEARSFGADVPGDDPMFFFCFGSFTVIVMMIVDPGLPVLDDRLAAAAATTAPPNPPAARGPANVAFARVR